MLLSHAALACLPRRYGRARSLANLDFAAPFMSSPDKGLESSGSASPLGSLKTSDSVVTAASPAISRSTHRPSKRRRVLLIDNAPEVHALVQLQLSDLNAVLDHAYSGDEGVLRLKDCSPELVLVDHRLLAGDVQDLLRKRRARGHAPPPAVIVLTGPEDDPTPSLALDPGAVDFLRKPFLAAELRIRIGAVLQTQALLSRLEHQATHDRLTGMLNRDGLSPRVDAALARFKASPERHFAVLFLDFDNFKRLNDAYGHDVGDNLLRQVGLRLRAVARIGHLMQDASYEPAVACASAAMNLSCYWRN